MYESTIFENLENINKKKKYAVVIWGELRSVKSSIHSFYEHLVKPLDPDIFILCQQTNDIDIDDNINLFDKNVIIKKLYHKFNTKDYFNVSDIDKLQNLNKNMTYEGGLQCYLNFKKIADDYGDILQNNYDYIILSRSDLKYLFDTPDVINLSKINNIFWSFEDDQWGGINNNFSIIPSNKIKDYLYAFYDYLTKPELINKILINNEFFNCEKLMKFIFMNNQWNIGLLKSNCYITADSLNTKTTYCGCKYSSKYDTFYKYDEQLNSAYSNFEKIKNGEFYYLNYSPSEPIE